MGAKMQEFVREQANGCRSRVCDTGRGTRNDLGANGLRPLGEREGNASPLTAQEQGGFAPEGAKKGASAPRTEWGLSEDLLAVGYAQCAGGVA